MITRKCGACQLCCKLLPVKAVKKPAGARCIHQKVGKGCALYHTVVGNLKLMPIECHMWTCAWLSQPRARGLPRPDRSGYVVDTMPDYVTVQDGTDGTPVRIQAVQVWVDPSKPDAHRDPALRAYLEDRAASEGVVAIIRYDHREGFTLVPPSIATDGRWHELASGVEQQHSVAEIFKSMAGARA